MQALIKNISTTLQLIVIKEKQLSSYTYILLQLYYFVIFLIYDIDMNALFIV